jgi:hypothetical protein
MSEKQYGILDAEGNQVASVWATSVEAKPVREEGFWFKRDSEIVAAAWFGYKDIAAQVKFYTPKSTEVPA